MQSRQTSAPGCWLSQANLSTQEMKAETTPPSLGSCLLLDIPVRLRTGCSPNTDTFTAGTGAVIPVRDPSAQRTGSALRSCV